LAEYLAPGVYVEETSFRSKSIEGVSTSTTGFVGPTSRGPVGGTPELITSLGDFERIYGGLSDLSYGVNYLAHAVRAYFNEGGARLYVSRVYEPPSALLDGIARSAPVVNGGPNSARFVARTPGAAGNGQIGLRLISSPVTRDTLKAAREGTLVRLRTGSQSPQGAAQLVGGRAPFVFPNNAVLRLTVGGGAPADLTFTGESAEAQAANAIGETLNLTGAPPLVVTIDGLQQTVPLPTGAAVSRDDLLDAINAGLRGGYARLEDAVLPTDKLLVIGSDRKGRSASVTVQPNVPLGFPALQNVVGDPLTNTVGDLGRVTVGDINALLPAGVAASLDANGDIVLSTTAVGPSASLSVADAGPLSVHDELDLTPGVAAAGAPGSNFTFFVKQGNSFLDAASASLNLNTVPDPGSPAGQAEILTLMAVTRDGDGNQRIFEDMSFDSRHPRWIGNVMAAEPTRRTDALENLYAFSVSGSVTAFQLLGALFPSGPTNIIPLGGGADGQMPGLGTETMPNTYSGALAELEKLEDISIVAAPGSVVYPQGQAIQDALKNHAEKLRAYRIAVLDTPPDLTTSGARNVKARIDSKYAALYYPWVVVANPLMRAGDESIPQELTLPPSGFVCGVYARNDVERGVYKAPANEIVRSALRFETDVNFAEQQVLNPLGVNCLRFFVGRGYRVWGARTTSSDPEWKYVNVRRYFNYLEASIDRGTQWAVFEPNGERLWRNITETVSSFLYNEWVSGALLGSKPEEAFFVRCDRSTMTQNDLDNGRLICLVGVAVIKPAEFVIFRIGQKTADARS
jgi:phage tail sheath protein FI